MSIRSSLLAGVAIICLTPSLPAAAADLYSPPPETDYEPPPTETFYEQSSWYLALRGGAAFADDTSFETLGTSVDNTYDTGPFVAGAVGYQFRGTGLRAEAEIGYVTNAIESHDIAGVGTFDNEAAFGDTSAFFGLASIYYDIPLNSPIKPFVGGGIGLSDVSFEGHGTDATGTVLDDNATAFAWHLTGGVGYDIAENVALEVGYRYLAFEGVDVTATDGTPTSIDTADHIVFAGLRYRF
ncbi:MAG: outer membrane beta-barrel protein [Hyphomicrobiaceae bacterium]